MASAIGQAGAAVIANSSSSNAPVVVYDVDADSGRFQKYAITNTGTTDGVTATTDWVYVQVAHMHGGTSGFPILPGNSVGFQCGFNNNGIKTVSVWTRAAGGASQAAGNVKICGGGISVMSG